MANELPVWMKISFKIIPTITPTSAAGTNFIFLRNDTLFHPIKMINEIKVITKEPNCMWSIKEKNS